MIKHILSILFAALFVCNNISAQHWSKTNVFHSRDVNTLKYLTPQTLIAAGGSEINDSLQNFVRSADYGLSWEDYSTSCGCVTIKSLDFSDTLNGFAVGIGGNMKKTIDAGFNWTLVVSPIYRNWHKVIYVDASHLFAVGGWQKDSLRQTIIASSDSGKTWNVQYDQPGPSLRSVYFFNSQKGYAVGDSGTILGTTNGGLNWAPVTAPLTRHFNDIDFATADTGYIVGGRRYNDSIRTILKTADGGATWAVIKDEPGGWLTDVFFVDRNIGKIVGDRATLLNSNDGGATWVPEVIPGSVPAQYFTSVFFLNSGHGAVGTHFGTIFLYNNIPAPVAATGPATLIDSSEATINGTVNTFGYPAKYVFYISQDSTFASWSETYPTYITSNSPATVSNYIKLLAPNTTYYYFITAASAGGAVVSSDTLWFTTLPSFLVITKPASAITATTAQLNATITKTLQGVATLSFEYGTNPVLLTNQVPASPSTITDSLPHDVSATLNGLQTNTTYYYRCKVIINGITYTGATVAFFSGLTPFERFETLAATGVGDTFANFNGIVSGAKLPARIVFEYGTTGALGDTVDFYSPVITDTATYNINRYVSDLTNNTVYYYRMKAITALGIYYSNIRTFATGNKDHAVKTWLADVSDTLIVLKGSIKNLGIPANIKFEYGETTALGDSIDATPATINDTAFHSFATTVGNLQPNKFYYYRIKAVTVVGEITGEIVQAYTGVAIPNWDFQDWKQDTFKLTDGWNILGDDYERVQGHTGNYALKVFKSTGAIAGMLFDKVPPGYPSGFMGGSPFSARPDSIEAHLNYSFSPGDSGGMLVYLYDKNFTEISTSFVMLTGNTGGVFKRVTIPVNYVSALTPDSIVMLFLSNIPDMINADPDNYIIADDIKPIPFTQPIMHGDFESWYDYPHLSLADWGYSKHVFVTRNNINGKSFVNQTLFNAPGDYAVELRNMPHYGAWAGGDLTTQDPGFGGKGQGGFPVSKQHKTFNGYIKWLPANNDSAWMDVQLIHNGQQVALGHHVFADSITEFTRFEIPMQYWDSINQPDTAIINIRAYNNAFARGPSVLSLDKLGFDGFYFTPAIDTTTDTTIIKTPNINAIENRITVYPNPAQNKIVITTALPVNEDSEIEMFDIKGQMVKTLIMPRETTVVVADVNHLNGGIYFVQSRIKGALQTIKIAIIK